MKMLLKSLLIAASTLAGVAHAQAVDRPWNTLQCTPENRKEADAYILYTRARLAEAEAFARGCEAAGYPSTTSTTSTYYPPTAPGMNNDCIQYIVGKSFGPDTAKKTCDGLLGTEFDCLKTLIEKGTSATSARKACAGLGPIAQECMSYAMAKGNGPVTARKNCDGLTEIGFQCIKYMSDKGYGASTSKTACANIKETEFQCMHDLIEKGYTTSKARSTCTSATAN